MFDQPELFSKTNFDILYAINHQVSTISQLKKNLSVDEKSDYWYNSEVVFYTSKNSQQTIIVKK